MISCFFLTSMYLSKTLTLFYLKLSHFSSLSFISFRSWFPMSLIFLFWFSYLCWVFIENYFSGVFWGDCTFRTLLNSIKSFYLLLFGTSEGFKLNSRIVFFGIAVIILRLAFLGTRFFYFERSYIANFLESFDICRDDSLTFWPELWVNAVVDAKVCNEGLDGAVFT